MFKLKFEIKQGECVNFGIIALYVINNDNNRSTSVISPWLVVDGDRLSPSPPDPPKFYRFSNPIFDG